MVTGPPIRNLGFILKDVSRLWVRYFEQHAAQIGMTLTQARVLVFLSRNEGTTQARLAELCDTDPMTLVRVLDRMEREKRLERRADPNDRRAYRVFLRPAADPVLAEIIRIGDKARSEVLAGITNEERSQLLTLLQRIQSNLLALVPASPPEPTGVASPTDRPSRRRRVPHGKAVRSRKTST